MILIVGGAYQGKWAYAKKKYGIEDGWIDGETCELMDIVSCRGIRHFHLYIRQLMERERAQLFFADGMIPFRLFDGDLTAMETQADAFAAWLAGKNPDLIITTNEIGCGIVPLDEEDALWREAVGRICTGLASNADVVDRVICGVGMRIK